MKKTALSQFFIAATAALTSTLVSAEDFSYNYIEGNYVFAKDDLTDENSDLGLSFEASFAINSNIFILGSYDVIEFEFDDSGFDFSVLSLGGGVRLPINQNIDAYGTVTYDLYDDEFDFGFDSTSLEGDGFTSTLGIRVAATEQFEIEGRLFYVVGEYDDQTVTIAPDIDVTIDGTEVPFDGEIGVEVLGRFAVNSNLSVHGGYKVIDEMDSISLGARYNF